MRLVFDLFEGVGYLAVSGNVSGGRAAVLRAGVTHLLRFPRVRKWVVDLSRAVLGNEAIAALRTIRANERLVWVGAEAELGGPADLEDLVDHLQLPEFAPLSQRIELKLKRDALAALVSARAVVRESVEDREIALDDFVVQQQQDNRTLRSIQTQIVNRIIDPVFLREVGDPPAGRELQARLASALGLEGAYSQSPREKGEGFSYVPKSIEDAIQALTAEVEDLSQQLKIKMPENSDRAVSLVMEKHSLQARIADARAVWIQQLEDDALVSAEDFSLGWSGLLEKVAQAEGQKEEK